VTQILRVVLVSFFSVKLIPTHIAQDWRQVTQNFQPVSLTVKPLSDIFIKLLEIQCQNPLVVKIK